jgi:pyruvate dehydrogenase E2 component (dihydrolipoamide acetyltransferase)
MAEKVVMLALSPTMETGTIVNWLKKEGDAISSGDVLCEVETDKATMEYESIQEGTLLKILAAEGAEAKVEEPIAILGEAGEEIGPLLAQLAEDVPKKAAPRTAVPQSVVQKADRRPAAGGPAAGVPAVPSMAPGAPAPGRIKASPLARGMAEQHGLSLESVPGSGPEGRIVKRDIETALQQGTRAPGAGSAASVGASPQVIREERRPVSQKRRIIAQRLSESKYSAPHYYLRLSVAADRLIGARKALNASQKEKVSFNAFLLKFAAETIKRYPPLNSTWEGDTIYTFPTIDVGLAVAQPDGLVTPVVRDCGAKGILTIDWELKGLIEKALAGRLAPEEYSGATFTITNLGSFGIEEFTAIINPPGSAILAVGAVVQEPVARDGQIAVQSNMRLTLSCDHRIVDGAVGARFLKDLKDMIEDPMKALY